jgi:hypothetical protein
MLIEQAIQCKSILHSERNFWLKSYYELFTWSMLIEQTMHCKSILLSEHNFRLKSYYELFTW